MERESWSSRSVFILAAIGSAVGLGNAWRFPGLAYTYGGGAFLLVYLLAMVILGFPLLLMELSIGRKTRLGAPGAFRSINKKAEWIGWAGVANAFFIVCYYAVVLAWVLFMVVKSFNMGAFTGDPAGAGQIFMNDVIQVTGITAPGGYDIPGGMILALLVAWAMIYLCIRKGTTSVGKVVKYTVFLPIILLVLLAIKGFTLPHAADGLKQLFVPDWSALANPALWTAAFGQVFYSLSIMMAIMIAYGSFVSKKSDLIKDCAIIAISDMAISVLAGIVLFTTISGTGTMDAWALKAGSSISTAFVVYPMALVSLSSSPVVNSIFAVIFYLTLLTLAIDSAFSIVEGVSTAISDKFHLNKRKTTFNVCLAAGLVSLLFATKAGLNWLDIVDHWCNEVNLLTVGVLECLAVGWFFKPSRIREEFNRTATGIRLGSWYDSLIRCVCPLVLAGLLGWSLYHYFTQGGYDTQSYGLWPQFVGGWLVTLVVFTSGLMVKRIAAKKHLQEDDVIPWDEIDNAMEG
nr:sodium-dependent transporter [bacterium]